MDNPLQLLATIARLDLGLHEDPPGSNLGSQIAKFKIAGGYDPNDAEPWCAMAVSKWVQTFCSANPKLDIELLKTGVAFEIINWGRDNGCAVFSSQDTVRGVRPGDIVVYTFSHCGIVSEVIEHPDFDFMAIEGNTNLDGSREGTTVLEHPRKLREVKAFVRINCRDLWDQSQPPHSD